MKSFPIECDFAGVKIPFSIWVGEPAPDADPLWAQQHWLLDVRGGVVPESALTTVKSVQQQAQAQHRSFEEICATVLGSVQ